MTNEDKLIEQVTRLCRIITLLAESILSDNYTRRSLLFHAKKELEDTQVQLRNIVRSIERQKALDSRTFKEPVKQTWWDKYKYLFGC